MNFDERKYIVPGVPRISQEFANLVESRLGVKEDSGMEMLDEMNDDKYLRPIFFRRSRILTNSDFSPSKVDPKEFAHREYMIQAGMTHKALIYAGNKGVKLHPTTGLPAPEADLDIEFFREYLQRSAERGTSSYLIEDLNSRDPLLAKLLQLDWDEIVRDAITPLDLSTKEQALPFIQRAGKVGVGETLKLLIGQNKSYMLGDQFRL